MSCMQKSFTLRYCEPIPCIPPTTLYGIPYDSQVELNKAYILKNKISEELEEKYILLKLPIREELDILNKEEETQLELLKKEENKELEATLPYKEYLSFCMQTRERLLKKKYSFIQILFRVRRNELKTNQEQINFWNSEINLLSNYIDQKYTKLRQEIKSKYMDLRNKIQPKIDEFFFQKEAEIKKLFFERIK